MFQAQLELYLIIQNQLHNLTDTCGTISEECFKTRRIR